MKAAVDFAIARPEDSDANAIFAGLQLYRRLRSQGVAAEIAIVSGDKNDTVEAQVRVRRQVEEIVKLLGGDVELYLVSDGDEDLIVTESLSSIAPVAAVRRIIIEQHLGIEGGFILILRYIRRAFLDYRFSRYTLGVPGLIFVAWGLLSLAGYAELVHKVAVLILGLAMIVKGFNLETRALNMASELANKPPLVLAGGLIFLIFVIASIVSTYYALPSQNVIQALGVTMKTSIPLLVTGMVSYILIARVIYKVINDDFLIHREAAVIALLAFTAMAFNVLGKSLESTATNTNPYAAVSAILNSGFIETIIIGAGIAGLIELTGKYVESTRSKPRRRRTAKPPDLSSRP